MESDYQSESDHITSFLMERGCPFSTATTVSTAIQSPEGRAVVARALGWYEAIDDLNDQVAAKQAALNRVAQLEDHCPALRAVGQGASVEDALAAERTGDGDEHRGD